MRAEGAFIYMLKRLDDAERDGDKIYAVVRGCALITAGAELDADVLTQGRMIVAPTGHAQKQLMQAATMAKVLFQLYLCPSPQRRTFLPVVLRSMV